MEEAKRAVTSGISMGRGAKDGQTSNNNRARGPGWEVKVVVMGYGGRVGGQVKEAAMGSNKRGNRGQETKGSQRGRGVEIRMGEEPQTHFLEATIMQ